MTWFLRTYIYSWASFFQCIDRIKYSVLFTNNQLCWIDNSSTDQLQDTGWGSAYLQSIYFTEILVKSAVILWLVYRTTPKTKKKIQLFLENETMYSTCSCIHSWADDRIPQMAKFTGPTWGPHGSCRPQMGPMFPSWTLLSRILQVSH